MAPVAGRTIGEEATAMPRQGSGKLLSLYAKKAKK